MSIRKKRGIALTVALLLLAVAMPLSAQRGDFAILTPLSVSYQFPISDLQNIDAQDAAALANVNLGFQFLFGISPSSYIGTEVGVSLSPSIVIPQGRINALHIPLRFVYHVDLLNVQLEALGGIRINASGREANATGVRAKIRSPDLVFDVGARLSTYFGLLFELFYTLPASLDLNSGQWYSGYWQNGITIGVGYRFTLL